MATIREESGQEGGSVVSKSDRQRSQITRRRLGVATKRPGHVSGDQRKSGEVSGGDWRPVEARGGGGERRSGKGCGDEGRCVGARGGLGGTGAGATLLGSEEAVQWTGGDSREGLWRSRVRQRLGVFGTERGLFVSVGMTGI